MADIPLVQKMRLYVVAFPTLATAPEMTRLADELEASALAVMALDDAADGDAVLTLTKRMLGCWARARKLWCEVTGEKMV